MSGQHRATPEQWEIVEICRKEGKIPWPTATALLELRARVEALEADQLEHAESNRFCVDAIVRRVEALEGPMAELRAATTEARPAGLVYRVSAANNAPEAIREVAAAARDLRFATAKPLIDWLEREAGRG